MWARIKHYILLRARETTTWSALIGLIGFFIGLYYKENSTLIWEATAAIIGFVHAIFPDNVVISSLDKAIQKQAGKIDDTN